MPETSTDESVRCSACGELLLAHHGFAAVDRLHGTAGRFRVAVCDACGSGTTLPLLPAARLADFYPSGYGPHEDPANPVIGLISYVIRSLQTWMTLRRFPLDAVRAREPGAGIDVGCGRGDLAAGMIAIGWRMTGIEPSPGAAANARARGVDVRVGTLADADLEPGSYDVAVLQHSLEHTADPLADMLRLRDAMRPDGLVAITVPNFSSWQARRFRARWYHLDVPRHRTHFTPLGLARLLERAGLEVVATQTSTSSVGLPATLQYALAGRCLFPDGLGLQVASGLCVAVLPLAVSIDRLCRGGDQLHVLARMPIAASISPAAATAGDGY